MPRFDQPYLDPTTANSYRASFSCFEEGMKHGYHVVRPKYMYSIPIIQNTHLSRSILSRAIIDPFYLSTLLPLLVMKNVYILSLVDFPNLRKGRDIHDLSAPYYVGKP